MDELLAGLLAFVAEFIFEALLEVVLQGIVDVILRGVTGAFKVSTSLNPVPAAITYLTLGLGVGCLSLAAFPHPLVHPSRLHGISLLISPIIAGLTMSMVGSLLRKRDKEPAQIESFGYGFTFAFGVALVRLVLAK